MPREMVGREETYEDLQDRTGLFVDQARDTLDTATTGKTADCGLGDTPESVSAILSTRL
jgi:hypothetical protein